MGIILVAYDGSDLAKKALKKADRIVREEDELILVHVIPTHVISEFAEVPPDVSKAKAQEMMNLALNDLKSRGIQATGMVREGDIADEIIKIGSELDVDLIVIGEKGVSKVGRFALGSVADKVMRYARRPVLLIK
jgi:nucleotide-binding universal stress UspA family protein